MNTRIRTLGAVSALAMAALLGSAGAASAQASSSTLRGTVSSASSTSGSTVTATDVATGFVSRARVAADGGYVMPGLRPGTYRIEVTTGGQTDTEVVTLGLGQTVTLNLEPGAQSAVASSDATEVGEIVVTGRRLVEVRTSEVATNVTQQQINDLPQISRNFLNFAALAPGVVVQEDPAERTISAGAQSANAINVFIDGQSQKSNILDGGIAGQDDSRGNPFPQAAVQEFRVLTQNFKAEYEQASSALITSVTRSGTNEFHGDMYVQYQDTDWIAQNIFAKRRGEVPARLDRLQYGGSLGGPIIQDRLHFFGSYERKEETRSNSVFLNRTEYSSLFNSELGTFEAPFEQDLFFGKLSWQPSDAHRIDLSATYRNETDIRDFGNQNAATRANGVNLDTTGVVLKHQYQGSFFLNEFSVDYLRANYNPRAVNFDQPGRRYLVYRDNVPGTPAFDFNYNASEATVFNMGGGNNNQDIRDESVTLRNDLTFNEVEWMGRHTIKVGARYSMRNYFVSKEFNRNPQFTYDVDGRSAILGSSSIPTMVTLNLPTTPADVDNNTLGLYIQDDWQISDSLELNLGLRWDYEDNAVNNDWKTPQVIRDMLTAFQGSASFSSPVNLSDYISDGDREAFKGAFQPRIGFSYDVFGDERTVVFGGAGRYYDRIGVNFSFSERFSPFNLSKTIYFSPSGGAFGGQTNTVAWNPTYATTAGLDSLLAGTQGRGEVFLVKNDAPIPHTDQFNFGVRQKFGDIQTAVTLTYSKTENEFGWYRLNVNSANSLTVRPSQFTNPATGQPFAFNDSVFYSDHDREREYTAMYVTVDKPFTRASGYGYNIAYTLAEGRQNGSRDQGMSGFDFDYPNIAATPWFNTPGVERHRIVASGTVQLPWDFRLSSIITLGSGRPFTGFNPGDGGKPMWFEFYPKKYSFILPDAFAFRQVDLRLAKAFEVFDGQRVELTVDAINIFNFRNYNGFNQTYRINNGSPPAALNGTFGLPTSQFLPTRSVQVGLRYSF